MNRAPPKFRDFAERLVSSLAGERKSSPSNPQMAFAVLDKLRPCMAQVIGDLGFSAVLSRALSIANEDVGWLRTLRVKPDGSLEGLDELTAKVGPKEIAEGRVIFLAEFVGLLVKLIGEGLVLQLVHQAMPMLAKDELHFGNGSHREKN